MTATPVGTEMTTDGSDAEAEVVLVDEQDRPIGTAAKIAAHRPPGQRHRAFSVLVHDGAGSFLLQQRALTKHHFAGLWSNTCCSHPRPGEPAPLAAARRLGEELGLRALELHNLGSFHYRAHDPVSGLVEDEIDHVVLATVDGTPCPDPREVAAWRWATAAAIEAEHAARPERFTPWFAAVFALGRAGLHEASGR
jgi:isopentenyl-diphosphate delta-isomerase